MPSNQYSLSLVELVNGPANIAGIQSCQINSAIEELILSSDGNVDPGFGSGMTQAPRITFTTTDIKTALDNIGMSGLPFGPLGFTVIGVTLHFRRRDPGGIHASGSTGFAVLMSKGLCIPRRLSASHGEVARIEIEVVPIYDGVNPVMIVESAVASGFIANSPTVAWTIGPWYVNNTLLEGLRDFSLDFGIDLELNQSDGFPWPQGVSIKQRLPRFEGQTYHLDQADKDALAVIGAATTSVTRAFLRKKAQAGGNVADGTAQHIRFDVAEGRVQIEDLGSGHPDSAMARVRVTPTQTGATSILAINTAAAIGTGA